MLTTPATSSNTTTIVTSTEDTNPDPIIKLVDAATTEEPYCFFPLGTPFSEINAKLWTSPEVSELSDTEHLERFLELKDKAAPEHRAKFELMVGIDLGSDKAGWGYSFAVNGKSLYDTPFLPIDKQNVPLALARYETEYFRQIFSPFSVDFDTIHSAIDKVREDLSKPSSPKEKLDSFTQLANLVPPGRCADMFLKVVNANPQEKTWTYSFKIGDVYLYKSDNIDQGDLNGNDNDYGYLMQLALVQGFRVKMRELGCPDKIVAMMPDDKIFYGTTGLGTDITTVLRIEVLANLAHFAGLSPSIFITEDKYIFALKGGAFFADVILPDSVGRADVVMSLMRIKSLTLRDGIISIMSNLERYQYQPAEIHHMRKMTGLPALPGATPMSLRAAVQDTNNRIQFLLSEKTYSPTTLKDSYVLTALTKDQTIKVFSVQEAAPPRVSGFKASVSNLFYSSDNFKTEVLQLLTRPLKADVYDKLAIRLSSRELASLQGKMHQTPLWEGGMSFGQALGVPKP